MKTSGLPLFDRFFPIISYIVSNLLPFHECRQDILIDGVIWKFTSAFHQVKVYSRMTVNNENTYRRDYIVCRNCILAFLA